MAKTWHQLSPSTILAGTFLVFLGPFLMVMLFPSQLNAVIEKSTYLVFHNIAEFFSIMVSLSVFSVGWYTFDQSRDRQALFLGTTFLVVGLLDFMHTMSNVAMPAFITDNSTNKSTQFWISARLMDASAFLISAYIYPNTQSRWLSKKSIMTAAAVITGILLTGIVFFPSYLPATAVPGSGLTLLKRVLEFVVIFLLIGAGAAYWKRMTRTGERLIVYYLAAFIICIFSEAAFASYTTGFDTYNVLGHIYKVAAFYLIYKGIFIASVRAPYVKLIDANKRLQVEISEREQAERALRLSSNLLHNIIDSSTDYIFAKDRELRTILCNEMFARAQGNSPADMYGKTDIENGWAPDLVKGNPEKGLKGYEEDDRTALSGRTVHIPDDQGNVNGELRNFDSVKSPLRDPSGEIIGLFGISRDVTGRKRAEEEVRRLNRELEQRVLERTAQLDAANKELEAFAYSVSHDLRAPVRTMSGFAKILCEDYADKLDEQAKNYLARIQSGSGKMTRLIDDLLRLSRISRQDMDVLEVDLSEKASSVIAGLREAGPGRKVQVRIMPGLKAAADPRLMEVVLENLLGNAWKFTSKQPEACIEFGANGKEQFKIVYYVRDDGAGFDPARADKLFRPFQRLHTDEEFDGTGIGLTIVERVISRHDGRVWAEGEVGKGATVYFTL